MCPTGPLEAAWLVPQQFHHVVSRVYEHVTAVQVIPHVAVHYPAKHIGVLPHVRRLHVNPELRSLSKAEHRLQAFQNSIYHSRGQPTLNAHVSAPPRPYEVQCSSNFHRWCLTWTCLAMSGLFRVVVQPLLPAVLLRLPVGILQGFPVYVFAFPPEVLVLRNSFFFQ